MQKILILCTGNSCRSIMAEALINHFCKKNFKAVSAGSNPAGYIHQETLETLKRHGIDPGLPYSKSWDEFSGQSFDLIITVCDQAANESCPVFLGVSKRLHWGIPDPAKISDTNTEIKAAFDNTFNMLKNHIKDTLK